MQHSENVEVSKKFEDAIIQCVWMKQTIAKSMTAKYMYKLHANMKSGSYSIDNISLVNTVHKYCTRQAEHKNYFVSNALTSTRPNCLLVNGTKIWNKPPHTFKSELNFRRFKHLVFDYLLKTYS